MLKYVKKYLPFAILAALFMIGEVLVDLIQPSLMSKIVDDGVLGINNNSIGSLDIVFQFGLIMIGIALVGGMCGSLNNVFVHYTAQNVGNDLRKDTFKKIMTLSFSQTDKFSTGSLVTRITNDVSRTELLISTFVRGLIRTIMLLIGSLFFMFKINYQFGLIVLCALPFIIGCMFFCLWKANPLFPKLQSELDEINNIMQEDIWGLRIIKACTREIYEKIRFKKANDKLIKTQIKTLIIFAFMNPTMNILMNMVVVAIILEGSFNVANGTTPGMIMASITYTTQLLNGILLLVMLFQNISRGLASWKRIKEVLDCVPEIKDGNYQALPRVKGKIEFKNVSFSYPGTNKMVLNNINLKIDTGNTVAIIGTTGSGKSSLVNLIARFYDATSGKIFIDDIDIKKYKQKDLRQKVTIALQKAELFSSTIKENILWGNPTASLKDVKKSARIAQADTFIINTPGSYNSFVIERGMNFSGGQKQRLSIARALLKESEILIFDDATSALDLKTEANLYAELNKEYPNTTKIIVASRVASAKHADKIIVLDNGNCVGYGNHEELINSCSLYQEIYYSQLGKEGDLIEQF